MNPRIKELAHEAGLPTYNPEGIPTKLEKFAELIVQECITVINQPNGVGDDDVIRITKDVEKHFGVEE